MEWNSRFSVGIESIDKQHRHLFEIFNELEEVRKNKVDLCESLRILNELMSFATEHFETEERYMRETSFPDYFSHSSEHQEFREQVLKFCQDAVLDFQEKQLATISKFISDWMERHLTDLDQKYVPYFQKAGIC